MGWDGDYELQVVENEVMASWHFSVYYSGFC